MSAPERETAEQTIRRLGAETPEQSSLRLGLKTAKQRRRRLSLKTVGAVVVLTFVVFKHFFEGLGIWNLSRESWYHRGVIAAGGILVLTIVVGAYRQRRGAS